MRGGVFLGVSVFIVIIFLLIYFFMPFNTIQFNPSGLNLSKGSANSNFSIDSSFEGMQFYPNMRYPSNDISYKIYDACPLKRKNDMQEAFSIVSDLTVLDFYPVLYGEEISVTCSNENIFEGSAFVAGEGGVTNVTIAGDYNVVLKGEILLLKDSGCPRPNVAVHELLHALGFDHSLNPGNIMYYTSDCSQTVGEDIPVLINNLYSINSQPDLIFENVSAVMHGKYLDANISVRNNGLADAPGFSIIIYADGKEIKSIDVSPLEIGYGSKLTLTNLWVNKISIDELEFMISADYSELDESNNLATLSVKK